MALKTILGGLFLAVGTAAFLTMMSLMGRPGRTPDTGKGRRVHKIFGWLYLVLLVPLAYLGVAFVGEMGDGMSTRGALHVVLAATLVAVLLVKVLVVRVFKGFVKNAPALGMALFVLTLVVYLISGGFFLVQALAAK
ncbi:MAG: DUF6529 family protein [Acidobacteria bacterium]|jgi:hypothetical protein|nr:DUF6529 family protein [Acidobacteriota bacterium]